MGRRIDRLENFFFFFHMVGACALFFKEIISVPLLFTQPALGFMIYLILIIVPGIPQTRGIRIFFLCLSGSAVLFFPFLGLLLPFHLIRILSVLSFAPVVEGGLFLIPLLLFQEIPGLPVLSIALFLVYRNFRSLERKLREKEGRIDSLEKENHRLNKKIQRLAQLEREKERAIKLEERHCIAGKLHDELGHTLSGSLYQLEAVRMILDEEPERAGKMIERVSGALSQGMKAVRLGLKVLKPSGGEKGMATLQRLLGNFEKAQGIKTRWETEGDLGVISFRVWQVIRENMKEALTNVLKHSGASEVFFRVTVLNRLIKAEVRDNGRGGESFKPGMGLEGIEERTGEAGGTLILDGSRGFHITMIFKKGEADEHPGVDC